MRPTSQSIYDQPLKQIWIEKSQVAKKRQVSLEILYLILRMRLNKSRAFNCSIVIDFIPLEWFSKLICTFVCREQFLQVTAPSLQNVLVSKRVYLKKSGFRVHQKQEINHFSTERRLV